MKATSLPRLTPTMGQGINRFYYLVLTLTAMLGLALPSRATVLVDDKWADATRTDPASPNYADNNGSTPIDRDSDGELESAWFSTGSGASAPVTAGHMTLTMGTSSASWETYFTPEATPVTLANAGDQIKITWAFTPTGVNMNNTSQFFRLAVVDSPSAARVTGDAGPGSGAYAGYAMFMNMGQTLGNNNPFQLMERSASGDLLQSSGNWTGLGNGATAGNHGYDSFTNYIFVMTLTRNASSGLDIVATMTGDNLNNAGFATVSVTDATPSSFTYDTFALRPSGTASSASAFDTTNFKMELIPEPSTLALIGIGLAGLFVARRRRR